MGFSILPIPASHYIKCNERLTYFRVLIKEYILQLRGNWKDINFQLHHRLSTFEVPVVVNLKHIFELFGLYNTWFLI